MSRRPIVRPEDEADLTEAALWYLEREAGLGPYLTLEVGPPFGGRWNRRCFTCFCANGPRFVATSARRFPCRIFHIGREGAVIDFAMLHAARHADPPLAL